MIRWKVQGLFVLRGWCSGWMWSGGNTRERLGRSNEEEIDSGMVSRRLLGGDSGKKVV